MTGDRTVLMTIQMAVQMSLTEIKEEKSILFNDQPNTVGKGKERT